MSAPAGLRGSASQGRRRLPVLQGVLPLTWSEVPGDLLAGVTLAALGIPEVLGYAKIAGMPVVTGLYTLLLPMAVFALLGSSRRLVVGADSATAAMTAAGLGGLAAAGSSRYLALAGTVALVTAALLLLARAVRLGFLANFLSRTVLVGFLTGVGISVAVGQLGGMLGVSTSSERAIPRLVEVVRELPQASWATATVAAVVIAVVLGLRRVSRRFPGALLAVVGAIVVSKAVDLPRHGVRVLGAVPSGLPHLQAPALALPDVGAVLATAAGVFVVVLAQSSATSRAYAAKHDESFSEDTDLVGLGGANLAAAFTGTFSVNGSPTKTQMVETAGGRSQLAQLTTCVVVLVVLLLLTGPLAALPLAVLAAIVFLIGVELIDVAGLRVIARERRSEFVVALLTVAAVVLVGVEQGIVLAAVASMVDHLRTSYAPRNTVLVTEPDGRVYSVPATPGARSAPGLLVLRFAATLYYANANQLLAFVEAVLATEDPPRLLCLDGVAIGDVDLTAGQVLQRVHRRLQQAGVQLAFSDLTHRVRHELHRYGLVGELGEQWFFNTPQDAFAAHADHAVVSDGAGVAR